VHGYEQHKMLIHVSISKVSSICYLEGWRETKQHSLRAASLQSM